MTEFNKIKVGTKTLEDAILNLGSLQKSFPRHQYTNKSYIQEALGSHNLPELRAISNFYYNVNGIYERVCNYFATLYRYDWYIVPNIYDESVGAAKVLKDCNKILNYCDNSHIKKLCGDISLEVLKNGAYYAFIVPSDKELILQQLPIDYCRSRYFIGHNPAIEFDMRYFDTFSDINYRMKVLNLFPEEFKKGYMLYKKGKLKSDDFCDKYGSWYLLDPESTVKFNFNGSDVPMFVNAVPAILDLDAAQDLDRRKQMQKLLKIIVQKLPRDKNGDLIFDIDEARDIHNNAVQMLRRAVGVDVLTTFADIDAINTRDSDGSTTVDDMAKIERALFNAFGISQNLFNTDGNMSLEKSILNDESIMRNLLLQFHIFFDRIVQKKFTTNKKYDFRFYMLETTQYNYKEMSKLYKEQMQTGQSKMLPQIALGHSQSFILNTAYFENEMLKLSELMIPPLMSSTLSSQDILNKKSSDTGGRPEKPDDQKSEKTIQNKESMK